MAHDVFLSYSQKNKAAADAICKALEANSLRVWMAPRDILPGAKWGAAIPQAIKEARAFVLVYSSSVNSSQYISRELERAVSGRKPIIPIRLENIDPSGEIEFLITTSQWVDAFPPPLESHLAKLVRETRLSLEMHASSKAAPPPTLSTKTSSSVHDSNKKLLANVSQPQAVGLANVKASASKNHSIRQILPIIAGVSILAVAGLSIAAWSAGPDRLSQNTVQLPLPPCPENSEPELSSLPGMDEISGFACVLGIDTLVVQDKRIRLANVGAAQPDAAKKLNHWLAINGPSVSCVPAVGFRGKYICNVGDRHVDIADYILKNHWATPLENTAATAMKH